MSRSSTGQAEVVTVIGSLNIDHVYRVPRFVAPGETLAARSYQQFAGGKGLNCAVALARAGQSVRFVGGLGLDGAMLRAVLNEEGICCDGILTVEDEASGHAIIQVSDAGIQLGDAGENAILVHGGANQRMTSDHLEAVLPRSGWLLVGNETNCVREALEIAASRGLPVAFNPSPWHDDIRSYPLQRVTLLCVNELEGQALTGESNLEGVRRALARRFPQTTVLLTCGSGGAYSLTTGVEQYAPADKVTVVDSTAAGDTFLGYFLAATLEGRDLTERLRFATRAAGLCVSRAGAVPSIPRRAEFV